MTVFNSTRVRHSDPRPYLHFVTGARTSSPVGGTGYYRNIFAPRAKFTFPRQHGTNPVLDRFRENVLRNGNLSPLGKVREAEREVADLAQGRVDTTIPEGAREHARKVLTKWISVFSIDAIGSL